MQTNCRWLPPLRACSAGTSYLSYSQNLTVKPFSRRPLSGRSKSRAGPPKASPREPPRSRRTMYPSSFVHNQRTRGRNVTCSRSGNNAALCTIIGKLGKKASRNFPCTNDAFCFHCRSPLLRAFLAVGVEIGRIYSPTPVYLFAASPGVPSWSRNPAASTYTMNRPTPQDQNTRYSRSSVFVCVDVAISDIDTSNSSSRNLHKSRANGIQMPHQQRDRSSV